jgi:hypothetical protein
VEIDEEPEGKRVSRRGEARGEAAGPDLKSEAGSGTHSEAIGIGIDSEMLSEVVIGKEEFGFGVAIGNRR